MHRRSIAAAIGLAAGLATGDVLAEAIPQSPRGAVACGEHAALVAALTERYEERQVSIGLQNNGRLLEVFASKRTGTWTILSTQANGKSCIIAVGRHFEQREVETPAGSAADGSKRPALAS